MFERFLSQIIKLRFYILAIVSVILIYCGLVYFENIKNSDNSLPVWLDHENQDYVDYQNYLKEFENDRVMAVAIDVPDAFSDESLEFVRRLGLALEALPQVTKVKSVVTADYIRNENDSIVITPLFADSNLDDDEKIKRKKYALSDVTIADILVSKDIIKDTGMMVSTLFLTLNVDTDVSTSVKLITDVEAVIKIVNANGHTYHLAGNPVTDAAFDRLSRQDQQLYLPIIYAVIFFVILYFFRSLTVALIPLFVQLVVVMVVCAVYFLLGNTMNVVTAVMGPVLVAVCVADCVHIILAYYELRTEGFAVEPAAMGAARRIWRPCLFTALTTFAGFVSFNASPVVPNRVLGMYTAFGVMLAYGLTVLFVPPLLTIFARKRQNIAIAIEDSAVQRFLAWSLRLVNEKRKGVAGIFVVLILTSIAGIFLVKIETDSLEYFPKHERVHQDVKFFNDNLSGAASFQLVLQSIDSQDEIATNPQILKIVEAIQEEFLKLNLTRKVVTFTEYVKKLNQAFHQDNTDFYAVPESSDQIAQLLFLAESGEDNAINNFKTVDNKKIHVMVRSNWKSSEEMNRYLKTMRGIADAKLKPLGIKSVITGVSAMWITVDDAILRAEISSFSAALIMVFIMMVVVLKNFRAGIISMIPNVVPILMAMGMMGFLKISLNVSTVMTAGIAIGITVDDSIHYLIHFKRVLQRLGDYDLAIRETNKTVGSAVIFTTAVLVFGFGVLSFSNFSPSRYFGMVTATTLFLSIFCEIFLMPLLLLTFRPFRIEN